MLLTLFILAMAVALLAGAAWARHAHLSDRVDAFVVALSGGALLIAAVLELIQPVIREQPPWLPLGAVLAGSVFHTIVKNLVARLPETDEAPKIAATLLLSGIPENMAVGITLIEHQTFGISALAISIFVANVPEAAGATKTLQQRGYTGRAIWSIWLGIVAMLAGAALVGYYGFAAVDPAILGYLRCFTAGAIVSSLAVDVFPRAFKADHRFSGLASVLGLILAVAINRLTG